MPTSQRTIILRDTTIHNEIDETERLVLSTCLWNDGTEIPEDWHSTRGEFMELKIEFSIQSILDDMIFLHRLYFGEDDKSDEIWLDFKDEKLIDLYKQELQKGIDRLNKIQFLEDRVC